MRLYCLREVFPANELLTIHGAAALTPFSGGARSYGSAVADRLGLRASVSAAFAACQDRTVCGEVRLEFPACRRLRLLVHERRRDRAGRLVVRTEWRNESDKPYEARIRVSFFDKEGRKENGIEPWDRQVFQPRGVQIIEWTANTPDAVRYMIEVKSASAWPF